MREQMLGSQARTFDLAFLKVRGGRLKNLKNGHGNEALRAFSSGANKRAKEVAN
jgi:hypothetical protein